MDPNLSDFFFFNIAHLASNFAIHLSKAFDRVNWGSLWGGLLRHGVSQHLVWALSLSLSPVRVRDYGPVKDTG